MGCYVTVKFSKICILSTQYEIHMYIGITTIIIIIHSCKVHQNQCERKLGQLGDVRIIADLQCNVITVTVVHTYVCIAGNFPGGDFFYVHS